MFKQVVRYYYKMVRENGAAAMDYTLEMFEGLTEAQIEYALATHDMDGDPIAAR